MTGNRFENLLKKNMKILKTGLMILPVLVIMVFGSMSVCAEEETFSVSMNDEVLSPSSTGNAILDAKTGAVISSVTEDGMSNSDKVRACYEYLVTRGKKASFSLFGYGIFAEQLYSQGSYSEEIQSAYGMLNSMEGDSCDFSNAFVAMMRVMGYNCYGVRGMSQDAGGAYSNHGWAVIMIDGTEYVFDPEYDMRTYHKKEDDYMSRFGKTYSELSGKYLQYSEESMKAAYGEPSYHPWLAYEVKQAESCDQAHDTKQVFSFKAAGAENLNEDKPVSAEMEKTA